MNDGQWPFVVVLDTLKGNRLECQGCWLPMCIAFSLCTPLHIESLVNIVNANISDASRYVIRSVDVLQMRALLDDVHR